MVLSIFDSDVRRAVRGEVATSFVVLYALASPEIAAFFCCYHFVALDRWGCAYIPILLRGRRFGL